MNPISAWAFRIKLIVLGLIITVLGAFHYYDRYEHTKKAVKAATDSLNTSYKILLDQKTAERIAKEDLLRSKAEEQLKDKDDKIKVIDSQLADANRRLLQRAKRPATLPNPSPTEVRETCTGRELYQEDGQFLTGEAARAEKLIVERDYYYEQYETARKILDGIAK